MVPNRVGLGDGAGAAVGGLGAGAVLTDDPRPWERLKLRTLNGVHSAVAYLGALAGTETIAEALRLPGLPEAMRRLIAEDITPSLTPPPGPRRHHCGLAGSPRRDVASVGPGSSRLVRSSEWPPISKKRAARSLT